MPEQITKNKRKSMVYRYGWALLTLVILLSLSIQPVFAQTYFFSVPTEKVDVYANPDGSFSIDYYYRFQNSTSADPIDIVDIGLPTKDYDLSSITATIDNQPVELIQPSEYIEVGVEIHLGSYAIQPGDSGELRVSVGKVDRILFKAKTEESEPYASFQFQPNFFGKDYVSGKTDLTVTLYLPPGLTENEPRWFTPQNWPGAQDPQSGFDEKNRVFYRWTTTNGDISAQYVFGAAFPARLVPEAALLTEVPFRLDADAICPSLFCLGFIGFIVFAVWAAITGERKRRLQYLPPKVSIEGNGIKRGLSAVEAALLIQQPMDKVLTMILFSVIKKGVATVVSRNPMKLDIAEQLPEDLRSYELNFLEAMKERTPAQQRRALQTMMIDLVKSVSEKMRGFSRKETMDYYQDIMKKAWQQVEQAQTPEMKMQMFDDAMDWTMLDRRFDDHTREVFGPQPVILPMWWGRFDPTVGHAGSSSTPSVASAGNSPPQGVSLPNLPGSSMAASMVAGMQSFASGVVGDVAGFTGGVTEKTNPAPVSTSSGSRGGGGGGGGHSCACACACAGCACACAGGGR